MSPHSKPTLLEGLCRKTVISVSLTLLALHVSVFIIGAIFAPTLYHSAQYEGSTCVVRDDQCLELENDEDVKFRDVVTSFRFPRANDEV